MEMNEVVYKLKDIFCRIKTKTPYMPGLSEANMQQ